jgi:hypothetical protein
MGSSDFGVTCLTFQSNILLGGLDRLPSILSGIQVTVVSGRLKVEDLKQTNNRQNRKEWPFDRFGEHSIGF